MGSHTNSLTMALGFCRFTKISSCFQVMPSSDGSSVRPGSFTFGLGPGKMLMHLNSAGISSSSICMSAPLVRLRLWRKKQPNLLEIDEYVLEEVVFDDWHNPIMLDDVGQDPHYWSIFWSVYKPAKPFLEVVEFPDSPLNKVAPIQTWEPDNGSTLVCTIWPIRNLLKIVITIKGRLSHLVLQERKQLEWLGMLNLSAPVRLLLWSAARPSTHICIYICLHKNYFLLW